VPPGIGLKLSLSDSATWLYEYTRLAVNDRVNDTKLGVYFCPGVISHRKAAIALNDLLAQQGPLARSRAMPCGQPGIEEDRHRDDRCV